MINVARFLVSLLLIPVWFSPLPEHRSAVDGAVVRAVLFYSPNCSHCHYVITEVLPPLVEKYGNQLEMIGIDVSLSSGQTLFQAAMQKFNLDRGGVPFLVIGDTYLIGSVDIPEQFPVLIDQYLAQGGVDWPDIPGLAEEIAAAVQTQEAVGVQNPTPTADAPTPAPTPAAITPSPTVQMQNLASPTPVGLTMISDLDSADHARLDPLKNLQRDPAGNGLALVVLAGMIVSAVAGVVFLRRPGGRTPAKPWGWLIPVLGIIGLGVAGYLAYVETAQVEAFCGPVGNCNTVQQSTYARLFGFLPIGVLGLAGYIMILAAWILGRSNDKSLAAYASLAMLAMTSFGLLFSIYLTFLEPFVIGATCAWCLTSAVIMTALFWLSLTPAREAWLALNK